MFFIINGVEFCQLPQNNRQLFLVMLAAAA